MSSFRRVYSFSLALVFGWCLFIVVAPLLKASGISEGLSGLVYRFFSPICHQFDDRSFHLAGEKLAVCIRCFSIYVGSLISLSFYPLLRRWHGGQIPHRLPLLLVSLPLLADVVLNYAGLHFSSTWSRLLTGALFGGILPLYIFPPLAEAAHAFFRGGFLNARKAR